MPVAEALEPPGSWNVFEIAIIPPEIVVSLNGVVVNRFVPADPGRADLAHGFVGLQNHSAGDVVRFRRVELSPG